MKKVSPKKQFLNEQDAWFTNFATMRMQYVYGDRVLYEANVADVTADELRKVGDFVAEKHGRNYDDLKVVTLAYAKTLLAPCLN